MAKVTDSNGIRYDHTSMNGAVFRGRGRSFTSPTFTGAMAQDDRGKAWDISSPNGMQIQDDKGIWYTLPNAAAASFQDATGIWFTPGTITGAVLAWVLARRGG